MFPSPLASSVCLLVRCRMPGPSCPSRAWRSRRARAARPSTRERSVSWWVSTCFVHPRRIVADSPGGGLNERDKVRIKGERPRGILNVTSEEAMQAAVRYWPSAALAPFVEHYWIVRWDLESPQVAERSEEHTSEL